MWRLSQVSPDSPTRMFTVSPINAPLAAPPDRSARRDISPVTRIVPHDEHLSPYTCSSPFCYPSLAAINSNTIGIQWKVYFTRSYCYRRPFYTISPRAEVRVFLTVSVSAETHADVEELKPGLHSCRWDIHDASLTCQTNPTGYLHNGWRTVRGEPVCIRIADSDI